MSRLASIEARLRREASCLRSERDEAMADASDSKRKFSLLQEEVRMVKAKLGRVTQEKMKMERDSRAAMSLARSLDSHASSDSDFYKRKVTIMRFGTILTCSNVMYSHTMDSAQCLTL